MKRGSSSSKSIKKKQLIPHKFSLPASPLGSKSCSPVPDRSATSIGYIQALDKQYHNVISRCEEFKLKIEYFKVKTGDFDIKHNELEKKCRGIFSQNSVLKDKFEMLRSRTAHIKTEEQKLDYRNSNCKIKEAEASVRLDKILNRVDRFAKERNELGDRFKQLKNEREAMKKKENGLVQENEQIEKQAIEIKHLEKQIQKLDAQFNSMKSYNDKLQTDYHEEQLRRQPLLQQSKEIDRKFNEIRKQILTYEEQKKNLDELQNQVLKDTEKFNKDMQYAKQLKIDLESQHMYILEYAKQLEAQRDFLKSDRENLVVKINQYEECRKSRDIKRKAYQELKDQYFREQQEIVHLKLLVKEKEDLISIFEGQFKERDQVLQKRKIGLAEILREFSTKIQELEEKERAVCSSISESQNQLAIISMIKIILEREKIWGKRNSKIWSKKQKEERKNSEEEKLKLRKKKSYLQTADFREN